MGHSSDEESSTLVSDDEISEQKASRRHDFINLNFSENRSSRPSARRWRSWRHIFDDKLDAARDTSVFQRIHFVLTALLLLILLALFRDIIMRDDSITIASVLNRIPLDPEQNAMDESFYNKSRLYPKPLGKKICLLDVDTRPWHVEDRLGPQQPQTVWGMLNHYLYAQLHGYDYKFVQAPTYADRHNTWVKVEEIRRTLQEGYQFVIFTDSDIVFPNLKLPMEYLLDHWNIDSTVAVAAALAPDEPEKYDRLGHRNVNTGFMIAQNTPEVMPLLKDWIECPSETKFADCAHWKDDFWHEQSAYSDFVRHEYENYTLSLPCDDADGAPEHWLVGDKKCSGKYVRHYWVCKECVRGGVQESIANLVLPALAEQLLEEWNSTLFENHSWMGDEDDNLNAVSRAARDIMGKIRSG